mgnify:CR=1 FL=1
MESHVRAVVPMKRDKDAYEKLWAKVIGKAIERYANLRGIRVRKNARKRIWSAYESFNAHASDTYMTSNEIELDRHKVAACYMCAVLWAMPLKIDEQEVERRADLRANERLSLEVGLSVLQSFLKAIVTEEDFLAFLSEDSWAKAHVIQGTKQEVSELVARVDQGIEKWPLSGHGTYVGAVLSMLVFMRVERNYNILCIALILFHLEGCLMDERQHELLLGYLRAKAVAQG